MQELSETAMTGQARAWLREEAEIAEEDAVSMVLNFQQLMGVQNAGVFMFRVKRQ